MPVKYKMVGFHTLNIFKTNGLVETYNRMIEERRMLTEKLMSDMDSSFYEQVHLHDRRNLMLPGSSKVSTPGTSGAINGGGDCGMLNGKSPLKSSLEAGKGDRTKKLSIGNDGNLRITADYGTEETVWDNEIAAAESMYTLKYTKQNDLVIYQSDKKAKDALWSTGTSKCSKFPAFVRLDADGTMEVWGISKSGTITLYWYAKDGAPSRGVSKCDDSILL